MTIDLKDVQKSPPSSLMLAKSIFELASNIKFHFTISNDEQVDNQGKISKQRLSFGSFPCSV